MCFRRFSATLYTLGGAAAGREKTDYDDEYQEECGHGAAGAVHAAVGDAQAERAVCAGAVHDPAGGVYDHRGHHDVPAEAEKEATIRKAEGQAEAIVKVNEATAQGLKMIKDVDVDKGVLTLKAYESLEKVADGQSTKIIIPSELQGLAGLALSASEIIKEGKKDNK